MQSEIRVDRAIGQNVHLVQPLAVLKDDLALLKEFLLQLVNEDFEGVCLQSLKVDDLEDLTLQPLLILILILHKAIIELLLDVREDVKQFFEVVFADHSDR